jgi:hypothetical protein
VAVHYSKIDSLYDGIPTINNNTTITTEEMIFYASNAA